MNEIHKGAMLELPATQIRGVEELLGLLKLPNPAYANRVYMSYGADKIPEFLTYFKTNNTKRTITVPRNIPERFYDKSLTKNFGSYGKPVMFSLSPDFSLRDYQTAYYQKQLAPRMAAGETDLNLSMPCGHGKTICALFLASLRMTNVVVGVTTHALAKQWIESARFMFPNNTVSLYDPGKKSYEMTDIVVTTYNMLGSEKCPEEWFAQFGHVIMDEVHRAAAKEFMPSLEKACCRYRTTLSATFRRKDGLHEVLRHHCGEPAVMRRQVPGAAIIPLRTGISVDMEEMRTVEKKQTPVGELGYLADVVVRDKKTGDEYAGKVADILYAPYTDAQLEAMKDPAYKKPERRVLEVVIQHGTERTSYIGPHFPKFYKKGATSSARIKTEVAEEPRRQELLLELISECFHKGRTTLVLSARKDMLYTLSDALSQDPHNIPNGVIASQKSAKQREYCRKLGLKTEEQERYCVEESPVILGIDKLAEEGFDVARLDTLIIAHPIRDIEQAVGRILRLHKGKRDPMVFYLIDAIPNSRAAWAEACAQFRELEHRVLPEVDLTTFRERYVKS